MTTVSGRDSGVSASPHVDAFVAQCQRPHDLKPVEFEALPPFYRALLVMDGTVTRFVEAYHGEPLTSTGIRQETKPLAAYDPWLGAPAGLPVMTRQVLLTGVRTGTLYAYAESRIVPDRLPSCPRAAITSGGELLGRVMRSCRTETYRELLWHGFEYPTDLPDALDDYVGTRFLTRAYQVIAGGRPLMVITEKFPLPDPDEHTAS